MQSPSPDRERLPFKPSVIDPLLKPIHRFMQTESAGGVLLLIATMAALAWANSPWGHTYHEFWYQKLTISIGSFKHAMSLEHWVNDGLMVVFFLLVGLEIKREILIGELASLQKASLPIVAAIGGMVVPASIFAAFNMGSAGAHGWGVPMATDIAFAVGVLALVGRSVPASIKVFLLAIAIVDDLGAVLVIAIFYTSQISMAALAIAGVFLAALVLLNLTGVHRPLPYILLGLGLWAATLFSGIHATIAGVLLAFCIPASRLVEEQDYSSYMKKMLARFDRDAGATPDKITDGQSHALKSMEEASQAVQTPLALVEHALLGPVAFVIVPIFALANAGVNVTDGIGAAVASPITWGVFLGLLLGKPLGVIVTSFIAIKLRIASLPAGGTWRQVAGVGVLCGIGFTMSLFVANLAFPGNEEFLTDTKIGILAASLVAGVVGGALIASAKRSPHEAATSPQS